MYKYNDYIMLENSDIGFPRFTSLRRNLRQAEEFGTQILKRMCKELSLPFPEEVVFATYIHSQAAESRAFGFATCWIEKPSNKTVKVMVGLGKVYLENYFEKILYRTTPHEIAHVLHFLYDFEDSQENPHGENFKELHDITRGYFRMIYPYPHNTDPSFSGEFYSQKELAFYTACHADKIDTEN